MEISQTFIVLVILLGSVFLFVTEKLRVDFVAILVLVALLITGLVPEKHILDGFSNSATATVAAMFILSAGLQRTGIVRYIAGQLNSLVGRGRSRLASVLMVVCGFFSAFTSNTATVAILLPVSIKLAKERNISPSSILMPLSFSAQFGGVCTLLGTTTNLLVNSIATDAGLEPFSIFEFAKLGLICFVVGTVYMLIASQLFLRNQSDKASSATEEYRLQDYLTEMKVGENSPLIEQTGEENDLVALGDLRILEIVRDKKMIWAPQTTKIKVGDILVIRGDVEKIIEVASRLKLADWAEGHLSDIHLEADDIMLTEVMIPHGSGLVGRTLTQLDFYWRYHAAVLGVKRRGEVLHERMSKIVFQEGDALLLQGHKHDINQLPDLNDFIVMKDLSTLRLRKKRALIALLITIGVIGSASLGLVSILTAALLGVVAMLFTGCLNMRNAYESVDMQVIVLLAGLIPLGMAMQTSGAANMVVEYMLGAIGDYGPMASLAAIYCLTMVFTALMSNAATAVILAPLALVMADSLAVDPKPFLMAVTFAASTCFTTPIGYQTNLMVYGPGGYRYSDFFKIGLPLNIIFLVISITLIPKIWPF